MADVLLFERRQRARPTPDAPPDLLEREQALDIRRSWIVEAPAGSGKTGLLVQRLLKLLADESVTEPEQVLAITFTVKATGELVERVRSHLEAAANLDPVANRFDRETRRLAEAVQRRDAALGWDLRARPERLRIRTIDSVCGEIARSLPVLSGSGGRLLPILDSTPLYRQAARSTLLLLGGEDPELTAALRTLLLHRDGNLNDCERLLTEMLSLRDQWGSLVPLTGGALTDAVLDATVLPRLERSLDQAICAGLQQLAKSIPASILSALVYLASEMGHAAGYKGAPSPIALCAGLDRAPEETAGHLDHWRALIHLLTTKDTSWRKSIAKHHLGFEIAPHHNERLKDLVANLAADDDLLLPMKRVRSLPPARYPPEQWHVAKALFRILQRALVELQLVFAERCECDFTELGLLARAALRRDSEGGDLAAALGMRLQHLLVDEMQDTSTSQYDLIELLTQGWDGQSQTVFLVGDPKQSVYLFRQARVERFVRAMRTGKLGGLPLGTLRLTANFRSQRSLVEAVNDDFARMFPHEVTPLHPEDVPFVAASAVRKPTPTEARAWHPVILPVETPPAVQAAQRRGEAVAIRALLEDWRAQPLPPGRTKPWSLAVLVRSREHLQELVPALKRNEGGGPIPFRAVNIELLEDRQEVRDLFALTRALLHPSDRVAWFALLRAPWCGLTLTDLHRLAGADDDAWARTPVVELIEQRGDLLTPDGCRRLERLWTVMQAAANLRGRQTLAQWVERTWRSLGGPLWLDVEELANANRFLHLLDQMDPAFGDLREQLAQRLKSLYAETVATPGAVDLMTIHGAKGLEWDVVLVPALERAVPPARTRLLTWMELDSIDPESAPLILAPIAGKGESSRELNAWLNSMTAARETAERKRLFYVACTRAREELHLFASLQPNAKGERSPKAASLLQAAWPAAKIHFHEAGPAIVQEAALHDETTSLALAAGAAPSRNAGEQTESAPVLHRLPSGFSVQATFPAALPLTSSRPQQGALLDSGEESRFQRPEGSFAARAFGNVVHAFIELAARRMAEGASFPTLLRELSTWNGRIAAMLRAESLSPAQVERQTQRLLAALSQMLQDPIGQWILAPHPGAASEQALTAWKEHRVGLRLDRVFRAGDKPGRAGDSHLWIVDFKTATHGREGLELFLQQERDRYEPQMQTYARALTLVRPAQVCVLLYYPLLPACTWWKPESNDANPS